MFTSNLYKTCGGNKVIFVFQFHTSFSHHDFFGLVYHSISLLDNKPLKCIWWSRNMQFLKSCSLFNFLRVETLGLLSKTLQTDISPLQTSLLSLITVYSMAYLGPFCFGNDVIIRNRKRNALCSQPGMETSCFSETLDSRAGYFSCNLLTGMNKYFGTLMYSDLQFVVTRMFCSRLFFSSWTLTQMNMLNQPIHIWHHFLVGLIQSILCSIGQATQCGVHVAQMCAILLLYVAGDIYI